MDRTSTHQIAKGISAEYREILSKLHRFSTGPFTVEEAAVVLSIPRTEASKLLSYLASHGWLKHLKRSVYLPVPLQARSSEEWTDDAWVVASKIFHPCYIGGWSAAQYLELTEQHFRSVVVCTTKRVRKSEQEIEGIPFVIRTVKENRFFGTQTVWFNEKKVQVSDASRTIVDLLNDPLLGGGIRHVADILSAYFESEKRDDKKLEEYLERMNNGAIYKRLGFLIEHLKLRAPRIVELCEKNVNRGNTYLDPDLAHDSKNISQKWRVIVNASFETET